MWSEDERGALASLREEIERLRRSLDHADARLQRLETGRRPPRERARPQRYYEVLIGVYETSDTERVHERPVHPYTRALLAAAPVADPREPAGAARRASAARRRPAPR